MYLYQIKRDGFTIGVARGLNKAVARIKKETIDEKCTWSNYGELPMCRVDNGSVYTIERE